MTGPTIATVWHEHKPDPLMWNAECASLGCVLINEKALHDIVDVLGATGDPYYFPANRAVFHAYMQLWDKGITVDAVNVIELLRKLNEPEPSEGWAMFVTELMAVVPTSNRVRTYAEAVMSRYRLLEGVEAVKAVARSTTPEDELMPLADRILDLHKNEQTKGLVGAKELTMGAVEHFEALAKNDGTRSVKTGYYRLDDILRGGARNSDLIIIAARPSHGKTAVALNIALRAAQESDTPVIVFSLEMAKEAILERFLGIYGGVCSNRLYAGFQANRELDKIRASIQGFAKLPITLCDETNLDVARIAHKAINFIERHKHGLIIVDYLQLIRASGKFQSRETEVAHISKTLKALARQANVPVIVCCQLNRESESQPDHFKKLAYLRESGSIEQDADVVIILSRATKEEVTDMATRGVANPTELEDAIILCVAKHRNGPVGKVVLRFDRNTQQITPYGTKQEPDEDLF